MRRVLLCVALCALAGCGKRGEPTAEAPPSEPKPGPPKPPPPGAGDSLPQTLTQKYQGQTADAWAAKLLDRDGPTSLAGARALGQIGPEGLRFALEGLKSTDPGIRQRTLLYAIRPADAREHEKVFFPILKGIIESKEGRDVRCAAIALVGKAKFPESVAVLEAALERETDKPTISQLEASLAEAKGK